MLVPARAFLGIAPKAIRQGFTRGTSAYAASAAIVPSASGSIRR